MTRESLFKKRFFILFLALLLPYFLHPLGITEAWGVSLLDLAFSLVLLIGVFAVSSRRHIAITALLMVVFVQGLTWTTPLFSSHSLILTGIALNGFYLIYTAALLLFYVLQKKTVTGETIFASLCVYLLIGYIWAFFYSFADDLDTKAFLINQNLFENLPHGRHIFSKLYYFLYFSFTTLTTLGFGDIIPSSALTRVLSSTEAMVGQLYLVVLVSRLVGLHISYATSIKNK